MSGGAIGAGLRVAFLILLDDVTTAPFIIFLENIAGSFLLGLLTGWIITKKVNEWPLLPFAGTGILGSFTTFSTLSTDIVMLAQTSIMHAILYSFGSLIFGFTAAFLGLYLGKRRFK